MRLENKLEQFLFLVLITCYHCTNMGMFALSCVRSGIRPLTFQFVIILTMVKEIAKATSVLVPKKALQEADLL